MDTRPFDLFESPGGGQQELRLLIARGGTYDYGDWVGLEDVLADGFVNINDLIGPGDPEVGSPTFAPVGVRKDSTGTVFMRGVIAADVRTLLDDEAQYIDEAGYINIATLADAYRPESFNEIMVGLSSLILGGGGGSVILQTVIDINPATGALTGNLGKISMIQDETGDQITMYDWLDGLCPEEGDGLLAINLYGQFPTTNLPFDDPTTDADNIAHAD